MVFNIFIPIMKKISGRCFIMDTTPLASTMMAHWATINIIERRIKKDEIRLTVTSMSTTEKEATT